MPHRHRLALVLLIALLITGYFWLQQLTGPLIASLDALHAGQKALGFVPIGHFGDSWPARIVQQREQDDRISFSRNSGQPHSYQGFDGYRLKMIRLLSNKGEETIVVYRSEPAAMAPEAEEENRPLFRKI